MFNLEGYFGLFIEKCLNICENLQFWIEMLTQIQVSKSGFTDQERFEPFFYKIAAPGTTIYSETWKTPGAKPKTGTGS